MKSAPTSHDSAPPARRKTAAVRRPSRVQLDRNGRRTATVPRRAKRGSCACRRSRRVVRARRARPIDQRSPNGDRPAPRDARVLRMSAKPTSRASMRSRRVLLRDRPARRAAPMPAGPRTILATLWNLECIVSRVSSVRYFCSVVDRPRPKPGHRRRLPRQPCQLSTSSS